MSAHSALTKTHVIHDEDLIYANEATLLAATGFATTDVGKVGLATSENSFWILLDDSPVEWGRIILDGATSSPVLKQYGVEVNALGSVSGTVDIDLDDGNVVTLTQTGNITFTISNPQASGIKSDLTIILTVGGTGGYTRTWPAGVDWPAATEPTPTTGVGDVDIYTLFTVDGGTTWYAFLPGADMG